MFVEIAKIILEIIKLAPRYLIAVGGVAAVLLFSSDNFLKRMGVNDFTQKNRTWLALLFMLSIACIVVEIGSWIFRWFRHESIRTEITKAAEKRLHNLTEAEKQILRFYIAEQTKTNVLRFDDGVVQGLVSVGIIYQAASVGNVLEEFAYNISDFAWDYLRRNIYLLDGTTNTYRSDKRQRLW
jgi:superinfection exclusion protein B